MVFLASKTCYWEQSWRLLRNRLWNMIWGVDHSTLQTKSSSFFIIRGNPVLTTGSSSLRPLLWKWHEQKFMCRNNISKLTLFKKVRLITPKLQVRLITPPDATMNIILIIVAKSNFKGFTSEVKLLFNCTINHNYLLL